jgi:hypothetical protein
MAKVFLIFMAHMKSYPTGIGNPAVLLGKTFCQERIAEGAGKWDINDPANMDVSDFCAPDEKFLPSESVPVNRDTWPR